MLGTLIRLGAKLVKNQASGQTSKPKVAALITASITLLTSILVASGVSPELSHAIANFVAALAELGVSP